MSFQVDLSPLGVLHLREDVEARPEIDAARAQELSSAFAASSGRGLLGLCKAFTEAALPKTLSYWRDFARTYLDARRRATPEEDELLWLPLPAPEERWQLLMAQAPPGRGFEYLSPGILTDLWDAMDREVHVECQAHAEGARGWLRDANPEKQLLGRVTFHLAENKRDETRPFAFVATYTHSLSKTERLQHVPLSKALQQYAGERNREALEALLRPVQEAAQRSSFIRQMLDSRHLFQPLAWTPAQAYAFMQEIPQMEASGLVVRVPDWWHGKRPARPVVSVGVDKKSTVIGMGSMLDFSIDVVLQGEALTEDDVYDLLQSEGNLVRLKGQWVEVDREKLEEALNHWHVIAQTHRDKGISFLDGMRLLSGYAGTQDNSVFTDDDASRPWITFRAGDWMRDTLTKMRDPSQAESAHPGPALKATLRPYQEAGVNWLWFFYQMGIGACLADDMGLGKTIQIIALLLTKQRFQKKDHTQPKASLLVVPSSLLGNWRSELEKFAPSLKVFLMHPSQASGEERERALAEGEDFYHQHDLIITTYGLVRSLETFRDTSWDLLVIDEAQAIKNPNTAQTRAVKKVPAKVRVALSGTPIENRLSDLWSLFDFTNPGLLGTAGEFKKYTKALETAEAPNYAPLRNLAQPYILRRLKTDKSIIADLPDKTEMRTLCHLTKPQAAHYAKAVEDLAEAMNSEDSTGIKRRGMVLAFLMRFKQLCNHPAQWNGTGDYPAKDSGKFQRLIALCEEMASRQEKVLIFTQFREMTGPLSELLETVFEREGLVLHGGTPVKARQQMVDAFQADDGPPFFVLSLKAGGTGLNLTAASQVIHFDRWYNPAVEDQATDRAFRIGQKRNVLVHKFICQGTIEEKIDLLISEKRALAEGVLGKTDGPERLLTEMTNDELLDFVAIDLNKAVAS